MTGAAELRAQLEEDYAWRIDEVRFLQNKVAEAGADSADRLRRALLLLLYAHFEGFCKFALDAYVSLINQSDIPCSRASSTLAAATLHEVFESLKKAQKKSDLFSDHSALDQSLHSFARNVEFLQKTRSIMMRKVSVPDSVVDTESNLWPEVLRKNLFRLGLPIDGLSRHTNQISGLVLLRNKISHGEFKRGIKAATYERMRAAALEVMASVMRMVFEASVSRSYLRPPYRSGEDALQPRIKGLSIARRLA